MIKTFIKNGKEAGIIVCNPNEWTLLTKLFTVNSHQKLLEICKWFKMLQKVFRDDPKSEMQKKFWYWWIRFGQESKERDLHSRLKNVTCKKLQSKGISNWQQ